MKNWTSSFLLVFLALFLVATPVFAEGFICKCDNHKLILKKREDNSYQGRLTLKFPTATLREKKLEFEKLETTNEDLRFLERHEAKDIKDTMVLEAHGSFVSVVFNGRNKRSGPVAQVFIGGRNNIKLWCENTP